MSNYQLQNNLFQLTIEPDQGSFNLTTNRSGFPALERAYIKLVVRINNRPVTLLQSSWDSFEALKTTADSVQGKLKQLEFSIFLEQENFIVRLVFALSEDFPIFLWKVAFENQSSAAVELESIELLNLGFNRDPESRYNSGNITSHPALAFHASGWQSWSFTGTFREDQIQRQTRLRHFQDVLVQNAGTPLSRQVGHFSGDFFGILADRNARIAALFGFLSQKNNFGSLEVDIREQPKIRLWANGDRIVVSPGHSTDTDWAVFYPCYFDQPDPFATYYQAVARENQVQIKHSSPVGWCSWYHFYQDISEKKILQNVETIAEYQDRLPLELIQIDDGFERQIGDWFKFRKGFPGGVLPLAREIKQKGFTPGLWLAPFILHPNSQYAINNPDKLLRHKNKQTVNAGFIWNVFTQALDLTAPGALDYALEVVTRAVNDWQFPYLKLDFLYAGALAGYRFDRTKTRAQVLRHAMQSIRNSVGPETFLLGCGAPLGSVLGIVDANRIGADVSGDWTPKFLGISFPFKREPHMPSARNSIQNILSRAEQHDRWWINDPDCLLIRDETNLTLPEVQSLATAIAITGGSIIISDDLPKLSPDRRKMAEKLIPVIGKRAFVMDWLDKTTPHNLRLDLNNPAGDWNVIARFNWKENEREIFLLLPDFNLLKNDFWAYSYWEDKVRLIKANDPILIKKLAAHGVALFAIRSFRDEPTYLGSNLHISMGLEVADWKLNKNILECRIALPRIVEGNIFLYLPEPPKEALLNQKPVAWVTQPNGVYIFSVAMERECTLTICM